MAAPQDQYPPIEAVSYGFDIFDVLLRAEADETGCFF
jgi:hypothetical protein